MICTQCTSKCVDCPTRESPAQLECPACNGFDNGCEHCDGGNFELTTCPNQFVGGEISNVIHYADLTKDGMPPIAGGALDQSAWFMSAARTVWADDNKVRADRMKG